MVFDLDHFRDPPGTTSSFSFFREWLGWRDIEFQILAILPYKKLACASLNNNQLRYWDKFDNFFALNYTIYFIYLAISVTKYFLLNQNQCLTRWTTIFQRPSYNKTASLKFVLRRFGLVLVLQIAQLYLSISMLKDQFLKVVWHSSIHSTF